MTNANGQPKTVAIIGGGIGGLALANLLARDGYTVDVYEKNGQLGGRAGELKEQGFTFDTGPSWYLMPEVFERYYKEFGLDASTELDVRRLDPSYKVFYENDGPITVTGDIERDSVTFEQGETGAGNALRRYARESKALYELSLRYFLYTDFTRLQDFMKPAILKRGLSMAKFMITPVHSYVSRFVRTRKLQQILEYPMVFLGTSPYQAPALYSLMGALDFDQGVFYPQKGIYSIISSLVGIGRGLGVTYHTGATVNRIIVEDGRAVGLDLQPGGTTSNGPTLVRADIIVSNADIHHTETALLQPAGRTFPETYWDKRQPSCSALLMYLGIKGQTPNLEHHNLLFVDAWRENFDALYTSRTIPKTASLYLSRTSKTDPTVAPADHETLFVLVPLPAGLSLDEAKQNELSDHYIAQIERMTGEELTGRIVYKRLFSPNDFGTYFNSWQNSMLGQSHLLRQSAFWRTPNKSKKVRGLYYVGATTVPGVGLPMCLISAQVLKDRIDKDNR